MSPTDDHGHFQLHGGPARLARTELEGDLFLYVEATYAEHVAAHGGFTGWRAYFGEARWSLVYDPYENTAMAREIQRRNGWAAWTTAGGCRGPAQ